MTKKCEVGFSRQNSRIFTISKVLKGKVKLKKKKKKLGSEMYEKCG